MALDKKLADLAKDVTAKAEDAKAAVKQVATKAVEAADDKKKDLVDLSAFLFSEYKKSSDAKKRAAIQKWRTLIDSLKL